MTKLHLVSDNAKPDKPQRVRRAPNVEPYCPSCGSSTWVYVNQGPADRIAGIKPRRMRGCWYCKHVW